MSDTLEDAEAEALLAEITGPATSSNANQTSIQVLFVPPKNQPRPGGRALGSRPRGLGRPAPDDLEYYEAVARDREQFLAADPVVLSSAGKDPLALLSAIKREVAREIASLGYQRVLNERVGRDTSALSGRRIDALKKIADIELELHKIGFESLDLHSEKLQRVFQFLVSIVRDAAAATLGSEQLDLFFNRLTTAMDGWEEKAEELIR